MNSRTSFFNKSIIRSDFRRFWWICALHTLALFLFATFIFLEENLGQGDLYLRDANQYLLFERSMLYRNSIAFYVFALSVPAVLATFLFSYLHTGNASSCLHGIPVSRTTQYLSHFFCGVVMITLPILINALVLLLFRFDAGVAQSFRLLHLFQLCATAWIDSLIAFSLTSAVSMLTGHAVAGLLLSYAIAVFPALAEAFIMEFLRQQLYGFCSDYRLAFSEKLYLAPTMLISVKNWLLYLGLSILFAVLGLVFYRIRKLENHSEVLAFPKLRPVFVYIVALCFGCAGYLYLSSLFGMENILFLIPFGLLGILIAEMLMKKSFRVKKIYKPMLAFVCACAALFVTFGFDLLGYERRVPEIDKIESAILQPLHLRNFDHHSYGYSLSAQNVKFDDANRNLTTPEELSSLTALHKNLTQSEGIFVPGGYQSQYILYYRLKNGRTLKREYSVYYHQNRENLKPLLETQQLRKSYFPILSPSKYPDAEINSITLQDRRYPNEDFLVVHKSNPELMNRILDALKQDLQTVPAEAFLNQWDGLTNIVIKETIPLKDLEETAVSHTYPQNTDNETPTREYLYTYVIRPEYKNTVAILSELGLYQALPTASRITRIGVEYYGVDVPTAQIIDTEKGGYHFHKLIEDPASIATIYNALDKTTQLLNNNCVLYFFTGDNTSFQVTVNDNDPIFQELLKR